LIGIGKKIDLYTHDETHKKKTPNICIQKNYDWRNRAREEHGVPSGPKNVTAHGSLFLFPSASMLFLLLLAPALTEWKKPRQASSEKRKRAKGSHRGGAAACCLQEPRLH
jgi:hypothetical protein